MRRTVAPSLISIRPVRRQLAGQARPVHQWFAEGKAIGLPRLHEPVAHAAVQIPAVARPSTGVLLVALGRTPLWIELFPESAAAEERYLAAAMAALEQAGFQHARLARLHGEPAPINMAGELVEAGVQRVLYALATESADSQLSQRILPDAIARTIRPEGVALGNMGAWNDDPLLVEALQQALQGALDPVAEKLQARTLKRNA